MGVAQSTDGDATDVAMKRGLVAQSIQPLARAKGNAGLRIDCAGGADVSYEEVQTVEFAKWHDVQGKDWGAFKVNRPYSIKGHVSRAPAIGADAPDGTVLSLDDSVPPSTLHEAIDAVAASAGGAQHVALIFGTITCPVWRGWAARDLHTDVTAAGVPVLHVYV